MHGNGEEEGAPGGPVRSNAARVVILGVLGQDGCELSAPQIHSELCGEMTLRSVRYHLRVLESCELIAEENGRYRLV
jgi:repressor of nif and glnA expression